MVHSRNEKIYKSISKTLKRLKGIIRMLLTNASEVPIHPNFERRQIVRGWKGGRR